MTLFVRENLIELPTDSFMTVRHLTMKGSHLEMGRHLALMGQARHGIAPRHTPADSLRIRVQRKYIRRNYPIHYERMRGIAEAFNVDPENDEYDLNQLMYYMEPYGCAAVFYPPGTTQSGQGILSRNFDFSLLTMNQQEATPHSPAAVSHPYIMEMYPDTGYSSLFMCNYDLANGVLDGINEKGLVVSILADDESANLHTREPAFYQQVGFHELQIVRFILDHCATVEEAKEALLSHRLFYSHIPLHYIIADRNGNSFVFEHSYTNNRYSIIDGGSEPFIVSNFLLHRYLNGTALPSDDNPFGMYQRYNKLKNKIAAHPEPLFSDESIVSNNSCAYIDSSCDLASRTLWHNVYNTQETSMTINFYLRDVPEGCERSEQLIFRLNADN